MLRRADIVAAPFPDPIGRDAVIAWPGGVYMQLYWHRTPPNFASLQTVPENRVYISPHRLDDFVRDFGSFAQAKVISDDHNASGVEIGRPNDVYRRVRMDSLSEKSLCWLPMVISHIPMGAK